jgi:iron complex outermembrane receptor protein
MKHLKTVAVSALAMTLGLPAFAQQQAGEGLESIVVTAQKRSERLEDVPITVAFVGGDTLAQRGVLNTVALKEVVPGLNMSEVGIYLMPNMRGITTTVTGPGADSNIAFYVDGVYQPNMAANVFDLPDVDHIEALKGPQGTLFGRNASGGAIQIFTKNPTFTPNGSFTVSTGVYSVGGVDTRVNAYMSQPIVNDKLAISLAASYEHNDGYMKNLIYNERLGYENVTTRAKILFQPSDNLKFILSGFYGTRDDKSALSLNALNGNVLTRAYDPTFVMPTNRLNSVQEFEPHLKSEFWGLNLRGEWDMTNGTITSITAYQSSDIYRNDADSDATPVSRLEFTNPSYSHSFSQELNYASKWDGPLNMIGGLYYFHDQAAFDPLTVLNVITYDAKNITRAWAAFAEATYEVSDRLSVVGGLRYSNERRKASNRFPGGPYIILGAKTFDSVTPRGSIRYALDANSNVYFTYSQGFKSGLFDGVGFNPVALSPEKVHAYEAGYKTRTSTYSLEAAAFYYDYKNLQVGGFRGGLNIAQNAGAAHIAGLDVNGTYQITQELRVQLGVSYIPEAKYINFPNASATYPNTISPITGLPCTLCGGTDSVLNATGHRLIRTPRLTGNLGVNYITPVGPGDLELSSSVYYSSSYNHEVTGRARQEDYATLSAEIAYQLDKWRLALWGKNLTDYRSLTMVTQIGADGDLVNFQPPLQVGVSVKYAF